MSEQNAEIVRGFVEALNRGSLDEALAATADDFVLDFSRSISPERGVYGRAEIETFAEAFWGVWESVSYRASDFICTGETVIASIESRNRGREGIELTAHIAWTLEFRDGRIVRLTFFQSREDALEAAGPPE